MTDVTAHRGYLRPHPDNNAAEDAARLRTALDQVDADVKAILDDAVAIAATATTAASEATAGRVFLASAAEAVTGTNTSKATTPAGVKAAADAAVLALIDSSPAALNTLAELAAALGNDASFATSVATSLGNRLRLDVDQGNSAARKLQGLQNLGIADLSRGLFVKADRSSVGFTRTGNGTVSLKAGTVIELGGILYPFSAATAVQMPTLTTGTDYAIYLCNDGTLRADASFTAATGFTATTSRQIGGFHYAPGGNAAAQAGGDATAQINPYSLWDIKFRPACADPRGMTLVAGSFWCDIYLTGVDHHLNGTSKYNVTIADGSSPPKTPAAFGGNGSSVYSTFTWYEAAEVMQNHGKGLLSYGDFQAAAFGATEASSAGTDPVSTILRQAYTSKWGVMLATGNLWVWGADFGGGAGAASYVANTAGRGSVYLQANAALFGGDWASAANSGSRASSWSYGPSNSDSSIGGRGRCDHLNHV